MNPVIGLRSLCARAPAVRRRARVHGWGAAVTMAVALAATPASALQLGSIIRDPAAVPSERDVSASDRARQTMNDYGVCLVKSRAIAVRRALAMPAGDTDAALRKLAIADCLSAGELRMPAALMRGAVYRALYLQDFGSKAPAPATSATPTGDPLQDFGACVNTVDPVHVRELVMATPATTVERTAIAALAPALGSCVAPGNNVRFSRATLQAVLAEAAYRQAGASQMVKK